MIEDREIVPGSLCSFGPRGYGAGVPSAGGAVLLSDAGVISQLPINWISLMGSGRSHVVNCGDFGHIEFVHTALLPHAVST